MIITERKELAKDTILLKIEAPDKAKAAKAGQFAVLMIDEKSERIPLTIADHDDRTITLVFKVIGASTRKLAKLDKGDSLAHFLAPLGKPSHVSKVGTVAVIGGGLGIAPIYPQAEAFKKAGNKVISIIGARSAEYVFWKEKIKSVSDELIICTDDGSEGVHGFVTDGLKTVMDRIDLVVTAGPVIMMKFIAELTRGKVKTIASLNPIMIDGVGMCGACRVKVNGQTKFACVDGPDFDAHQIDFDLLINRNQSYKEEEDHACRCVQGSQTGI